MNRLPVRLQLVLAAVHVVAFATFVRSILVDRWATVLAAAALALGAQAALASRTWGVGLVLASATAFAAAAALGMGPAWFWGVAITGTLPYAMTFRPMARFDVGAAALFGVLAAAGGTLAALGYEAVCPFLLGR